MVASIYLLAVGSVVEFVLTVFALSTNGLFTGDDVDNKVLASLTIALIAVSVSPPLLQYNTID